MNFYGAFLHVQIGCDELVRHTFEEQLYHLVFTFTEGLGYFCKTMFKVKIVMNERRNRKIVVAR